MGLLGRLQRHSRPNAGTASLPRVDSYGGIDCTSQLPRPVLTRIFSFVCPHAGDTSYDTSEESTPDGCMLCDMRDLAHCALVSKRWSLDARSLLYTNVRIEPVHYCELEVELVAKRKRRSFFDRNSEPIDAPQVRLMLFMRSVRESHELGNMVLSLRMPYMTREASKADIARTVSVLPHIRYVDLPAGCYSDEASCLALKHELMARCPDIRRMSWRHGAEGSFARLPDMRLWEHLEVLEVSGLQLEANVLRRGIAVFPRLHDLTLEDLHWLEDSALTLNPSLPPFPALRRLTLRNTPNVTASGLAAILSLPNIQSTLRSLTLSSTGVFPSTLHQILSSVPHLESLLVVQDVSRSFPMEQVPPLASQSLRLLHYEITSETGSHGSPPTAASYYTYLISSLLSQSLPSLRDLYVRDAHFADVLLLEPPARLVSGGENGSHSVGGALSQPLNVYSKGLDELEWNFTPYQPDPARKSPQPKTRPVSFQEAQLSRSWGGDARKSVLVGNGFGGFLAVPADDERPSSSGASKRTSRQDLWR